MFLLCGWMGPAHLGRGGASLHLLSVSVGGGGMVGERGISGGDNTPLPPGPVPSGSALGVGARLVSAPSVSAAVIGPSSPAPSTFSTSTSLSLWMSMRLWDRPASSGSDPSEPGSKMLAGSSPTSRARPTPAECARERGGRSEKSTVCWLLSGLLLALLWAGPGLLSLSRVMMTGGLRGERALETEP